MKNKVNLPWECEPNYKQMAPNLTLMLSELNWPQWKAVTPKQSELVGLKVRECYIMYDKRVSYSHKMFDTRPSQWIQRTHSSHSEVGNVLHMC